MYALFFLSGDEDHLNYILSRGVTLDQLGKHATLPQDKSLFECVSGSRSITEQYFNERCALSKSVFEKKLMMQGIASTTPKDDTVPKRKI